MNDKDWIPVTERLPENEGLYLVTDNYYKDVAKVCLANFRDKKWFDSCYTTCEVNAVAWIETPPPYQPLMPKAQSNPIGEK